MNTKKFLITACAVVASGLVYAEQRVVPDDVLSITGNQYQMQSMQAGRQERMMDGSQQTLNSGVIYNPTPKTRAQVNDELRQAAARGDVPVDIEHTPELFAAQMQRSGGRMEETSTGQ